MKVLIIAGEASGDLHGAGLIHEMKGLDPHTAFFAVGGERMAAEGATILFDCRKLAVMGIVEVLGHANTILECFRVVRDFLKVQRPDAVILIDYPDFNLRIARAAKRMGIKVIYFISPQIWAWRRGRVRFISRWVDRMLVIFPFEVAFYKEAGVHVRFVGHPIMDSLRPRISQESFKVKFGLRGDERLVALMPGSRHGEVKRILPVMLEGSRGLMERHPGNWRFALIVAPTIDRESLEPLIRKYADVLPIVAIQGYTYEALRSAEIAFVASGTATLEAAVIGVPMVVLYRLSWPTYWIGRMLVRVPAIGLVNIVAGATIVPELIQADATGEHLADTAVAIMTDHDRRRLMIQGLARVRRNLGEPGAAARAAREVIHFLGGRVEALAS
ncbi:MAG: lipid-A-disaccharide synthase [bacterium]